MMPKLLGVIIPRPVLRPGNSAAKDRTGKTGNHSSGRLQSSRLMPWPRPGPARRCAALAIAICCVHGAVLFLGGCSAHKDTKSALIEQRQDIAPAAAQVSGDTQTHVEMVNVNIRLDPVLIVRIHYLSGEFLSTRKGQPPAFDDKLSYVIAVDSAEVGVSAASMSHALNTYAFGAPDAPIKNLTLSIQGNQITQTGTLNKGIGIPFEMTGAISATADGRIRLQPTHMKAAHLQVKGVMKLLGLDVAKLVNTRKTKGVSIEGNDLVLDPARMFPPPMMRGRITAVNIQGGEIVETIGTARKIQPGNISGGNYMAYRGGVLRFGKLTMTDTDMRLVDADPSDPFDFFPDHYQDQLVAGYSKTTATGGLLVYMPDYGKIPKPHSPHLAETTAADRMVSVSRLR